MGTNTVQQDRSGHTKLLNTPSLSRRPQANAKKAATSDAQRQTWGQSRAIALQAERIRLAYSHANGGILTTFLVMLLTAYGLQAVIEHTLLLAWMTAATLISAYRLFCSQRFKHAHPTDHEMPTWERRFIIGSGLGGSIWGMAGLLTLTIDSAIHHVLLIFVIGGMAAGALSTLTPVLTAYRAFSLIAITPALIIWLAQDQQVFNIGGFAILIYLFLIMRSASNLHNSIIKSLALRLENKELIDTLSIAKAKTEKINHELEGEILERQREADIRLHKEQQLQVQQEALFELARYETINHGNLQAALEEITRTASTTLNVARAGIWLYDDEMQNLALVASCHADGQEPEHQIIQRSDCINYFNAVEDNLVLAVEDVMSDERTKELNDYFESHHISSLLDAPIRLGGRPVGILCHEHVGETRTWSLEEQNFAAALVEMCALALGQEQRRQTEEALFKEKEKAQVTVEAIGEGIITTDVNGIIEYLSPVACQLTGYSVDDAVGRHLDNIINLRDEGTDNIISQPFYLWMDDNKSIPENLVLLDKSERIHSYVEITASKIKSRNGENIGAVLIIHDVSELKGMAKQMSYQAMHDSLTGLINRLAFEEQLRAALSSARNEGKHHILLYMDLDQFKLVNDSCGHIAGDELLRQIANTLNENMRESDNLARLGGDEFAAILHGCNVDNAMLVADKMRQAVKDFQFIWNNHVFDLGISIGVALIDGNNRDITEVLSAADAACYVAKSQGRNRIHLYHADDAMITQRHGDVQWTHKIKQALNEDRFVIYYQPAAALSEKESTLSYCEILVRMLDSDGEIIPPMEFIPAAERYLLMPSIDKWVIESTLEMIIDNDTVLSDYDICAINLSGQSLCDEQFLDFLLGKLAQSNINPASLCFEITETAAIANIHKATEFISSMKAMGCRFALDDFGSGLSSFSYLKNLDVDFLKIDGNFVKDMAHNGVDHAMVSAINEMGHILSKMTIAEFVEDQKIIEKLNLLNVDYAQGYGVKKPLPVK